MLRWIWRILVGFLALTGLSVVVLIGLVVVGVNYLEEAPRFTKPLPQSMILSLDLRGRLPEVPANDLLSLVGEHTRPTLAQTVVAIRRAATDPHVDGLIAWVDEGGSLAQAQELRAAILRFRRSGKRAWAYSDGFGELSPGQAGYLLATGFDRIQLQPAGTVGLTGFALEMPYAKDALDRLGVKLEVTRRAEYKSAFDPLIRTEMSGPEREMLGAYLGEMQAELVGAVASGRKLSEDRARELVAGGPWTAKEAMDQGLIDGIGWWDDVRADLARDVGGDPEIMSIGLHRYLTGSGDALPNAPTIAVIEADGPIVRGDSGDLGQSMIAADDLYRRIQKAADDDGISALVLRLNSPGGSPAASETVSRAITLAKDKRKSVIVSMGEVAASGGYWIAKGATAIHATPATLTGSIGVIALKPDLSGLSAQYGIGWTELSTTPEAGMWAVGRPSTPAEAARSDHLVGALYDSFVQGVALARNLPAEEVEKVARGRVWSGSAAKAVKLVDATDGLLGAIDDAVNRVGASEESAVTVRFVASGDTVEQIVRRIFGLEARVREALGVLTRAGAIFQPGLRAVSPEPVLR